MKQKAIVSLKNINVKFDGEVILNNISLDITDKESVEKVITELKPDAVIHCAAWTAVDLAEDEDKKDKVRAINARYWTRMAAKEAARKEAEEAGKDGNDA